MIMKNKIKMGEDLCIYKIEYCLCIQIYKLFCVLTRSFIMCFCVSELTNCSDMLIIPRVPRDSRRHYACLMVQLRAKNTILQCVLTRWRNIS
jgi:hypothetical protein